MWWKYKNLYGHGQLHCSCKSKWYLQRYCRRFNTSNFEIDRPLPKGKNKKVNGLMKDELGRNIMREFD